ncbi:hypothetical protein NLX83_22535 [Allokutzneria sp. A3M-2-11 16]|uniref:hypothetical protein n=1 Tax=Allokutzneria sp. A3M-2-11 16 TaxID=2962043 RepID=UPI0020B72142|nr:hypothetical protein [Allokutzneria sp. A3M-2-11 16]MCP3802046.1 hypothetical protein [Allokutzneria sp. A3M-2-11 16]
MRTGLALLLLAASTITAVPAHAEPGCAVDRLPRTMPQSGSIEERQAADILAACLQQAPARTGPARNQLKARSVTARSVSPAPGTAVSIGTETLEIVDATLVTARGHTEFHVADARLSNVELRADSLSGKLFGLVPITLGNGLPIVPVPYLRLTEVTADNVRVTARTATLHAVDGS